MFYNDWGFSENPFNTMALPASALGLKLLVGRDSEIKQLERRIDSPSKIATIEGLNGSGKTSLANVVLFKKFSEINKLNVGPFYIPCRKIFQISEEVESERFKRNVLLEVAQTLIETHASIPPRPGRTPNSVNPSLDRFLNSSRFDSFSATLMNLGVGKSVQPNTGFGYAESGFEREVCSWLEELFPTNTSGAVVCIIDNLELLQTSEKARIAIENFRDDLFSTRGIKWILCGALGIVHGIASSPRLDGRLHKPIIVEDLSSEFAAEVLQSRVRAFRQRRDAKLPISQANFVEIFEVMRGNIRSALSEADDFCNWVADEVDGPDDFTRDLFKRWWKSELEAVNIAVRRELRPRALEVFEEACKYEIFSPSDCEEFGYDTPQAMRPQIKALEEVGLLRSAIDDSDKRRKTIQVTPKGWKLRAYLDSFAK